MKRGQIIKHEQFKDIAYRVLQITELPHKLSIKAELLNQGFVNTFSLGQKHRLTIKRENLKHWLICNESMAACIRDVGWRKTNERTY